MKQITQLQPNQVFIFGSNSTGFSGAGSAGLACRGTSQNTWRTDPWFLAAKDSPVGSPMRIGKWAVYGVSRGFQVGREGMSYAIETIRRPGMKRSTPLAEIEQQFYELAAFARSHPEWEFLMTPVGVGLAGYTVEDLRPIWERVRVQNPANIIAPDDLYGASPAWTMT